MNVLAETLKNLRIGDGKTFAGLTLFPLFRASTAETAARERSYLTLDEALAAGTVRVTEVGAAGHVPELCVENRGDRPVLLLDGEELKGAKQNRVLNLTVLAPAGKTIVIPVSCVEAGRWHAMSDMFEAEGHVMVLNARREKAGQVSLAMAANGSRRSDQRAVWDSVAQSASRYRSPSRTGAMGEIYRQHGKSLDEYVAAFSPQAGQLGAIFAVAGAVRGVETFDHAATLAVLLPKVLRSWALEVIDRPASAHSVPGATDARAFLDLVADAGLREHAGVGLGSDLRFDDPRIAGGALLAEGDVVHLCAFGLEGDQAAGDSWQARAERTFSGGRMTSPRRRYRS